MSDGGKSFLGKRQEWEETKGQNTGKETGKRRGGVEGGRRQDV